MTHDVQPILRSEPIKHVGDATTPTGRQLTSTITNNSTYCTIQSSCTVVDTTYYRQFATTKRPVDPGTATPSPSSKLRN